MNDRPKLIAGAIAVAAGLAALVLVVNAPAPRRAPPVAATNGDADTVSKAELAGLRREVAQLRQAGAAAPVGGGEQPRAAAPAPPMPPPTAENVARVAAELEGRLAGEGRDAAWGARTENEIAAVFRGPLAGGSRLTDASCGRSVCRVRVTHDSADERARLLDELKFVPPFDTEGLAQESGSAAAPESVIYISRREMALFSRPR